MFSMSKFAKGSNSKQFFLFPPGNLLIISYKPSKFEAPSFYSFKSILIKIIMTLLNGHNSTKGDNPD